MEICRQGIGEVEIPYLKLLGDQTYSVESSIIVSTLLSLKSHLIANNVFVFVVVYLDPVFPASPKSLENLNLTLLASKVSAAKFDTIECSIITITLRILEPDLHSVDEIISRAVYLLLPVPPYASIRFLSFVVPVVLVAENEVKTIQCGVVILGPLRSFIPYLTSA